MKIRYIDKQGDLNQLLEYLAQKPAFAFDLEFDKNRYQYGFTMCLMQVFDGSVCYIIDPLAPGLDITSVFPLMSNPEIQKLGFELGEDLRLFHSMQCPVKNIYDVSIASKLLDHSQISLVNAIDRILGLATSKGSQKSNWVKRPLSETQINYAAEDVLHLFDLKSALEVTLRERGMLDWVEQERELLERIESAEQDGMSHLKPRDSNGFSQADWHVVKGLMELREQLAEQHNRPAYQVLDKEYLFELAKDDAALKAFHQKARPLRSLNSEAFKQQLKEEVAQLRQDAEERGLESNELAFPRQSKDEIRRVKAQKKAEEENIESYMKPIQSSLKNALGEHAAIFILGNRLMRELVSGDQSNLVPYKSQLVIEHADLAGVDLSAIGLNLDAKQSKLKG
ncbi:MAG: ribonuclease D [Cryomorphaceae bacterium]